MSYLFLLCPFSLCAHDLYMAFHFVSKTRDCAKQLVSFHAMAGKSKLQAVYRKYSNPERGAVSLLPPAALLL